MKTQFDSHRRTSALVGVICFLTPSLAFAASGEGFPWVHWGVSMVNFAIFMGIIIYFAGPKIQQFFEQRQKTLVAELEAAKRLREEAEAKLAEYEKRMASLDDERKQLMDEYHAQGEREKERLVADAKRQVEKMRRDAELIIQQDTRKAIAAIEQQAVNSAVALAQDELRTRLDDHKQHELVSQYVNDIKSLDAEVN